MKKKILLFAGFVGGRGSSKTIFWLYQGLKKRGYQPLVVCESVYLYKLVDLGLKPDLILKRNPLDSDRALYQKCQAFLDKINFDYLISFSPRTYAPYYAFQKRIPYAIAEYSTPFAFEKFPSRYLGEVYQRARLYLIFSPLPLKLPRVKGMKNMAVVCQPYPNQRIKKALKIRQMSPQKAREKLFSFYPEIRNYQPDLMIFLNINDEYLNPFNIFPNNIGYQDRRGRSQNGYLSIKAQEQTLGFVTRLIAGLETNFSGRSLIYLLEGVQEIVQPVLNHCVKVRAFSRSFPFVNLEIDLLLKKAADINLCRASLCDNMAELYFLGKPAITTIVPTGFMSEELGLQEALKLKTAWPINYDDPEYLKKLTQFLKNKARQKKISLKMIQVFNQMWRQSNPYPLLEKSIQTS